MAPPSEGLSPPLNLSLFFYTSPKAWAYTFSLEAPLDGPAISPLCKGAAFAFQHTGSECWALARERGAWEPHALGASISLSGGDACAGGPRRVQLVLLCAPGDRTGVLTLAEDCGACCYTVHVASPAGCPPECARSAAGLLCGGAARGECTHRPQPGCACRAGWRGRACDEAAGLLSPPPGATHGDAAPCGSSAASAARSAAPYLAAATALALAPALLCAARKCSALGRRRCGSAALAFLAAAAAVRAFLWEQSPCTPAGASPAAFRGAPPPPPPSPLSAAAAAACAPALPPLDFFEIGTSDFNTEAHAAAPMELLGGDRRKRGVSVDAMAVYLERLPPLSLGRIFNAAVVGFSPHNATLPVFFVHPRDILAHSLPDYLRGCNSVGRPSWLQLAALKEAGAAWALRATEVRVLSISALLVRFNGCRVALLKLDVEGLDAHLALGYADFLWRWPRCFADKLMFEVLHAATKAHVQLALALLGAAGYAPCPEGVPDKDSDVAVYYSEARDQRSGGAATRPLGAPPPLPELDGAQRALLEEMAPGALWDGGAWGRTEVEAAACPWTGS